MDENPNATAAYAVCIYGIEQDTDSSGKTMGLTFGPALGADYTNASVSHEVNAKGNIADSDAGKTQSGNAYRCVHCDNRETIIEWNTKDPYVYEQCLEKGCTHKLELDFSQASMESFRNSFVFTGSGDGPSVLFRELLNGTIPEDFYDDENSMDAYFSSGGAENLIWSSTEYFDSGRAGSRIRAMLNGAQAETDTTSTNPDGYVVDPASIYTENNCLLAAFPEELREAIGQRRTAYGASYDTDTASYTYDKLFLFSVSELASDSSLGGFDDTVYLYHTYDSLEQNASSTTPCYAKWAQGGLTYFENNTFVGYIVSDPRGGADAAACSRWLRSDRSGRSDHVVGVNGDGRVYSYLVYIRCGVAPGFSLTR